ncbi:MAG: hypothetical protein ACK4SY_08715 [Pyrobaculum sp.]
MIRRPDIQQSLQEFKIEMIGNFKEELQDVVDREFLDEYIAVINRSMDNAINLSIHDPQEAVKHLHVAFHIYRNIMRGFAGRDPPMEMFKRYREMIDLLHDRFPPFRGRPLMN